MLTTTINIGAGQSVKFNDLGDFLRILEATDPITVRTFKNGQVVIESVGVKGGFAEGYQDPFDAVEVYSATAQSIQLALRLGSMVYYDQAPTGNVLVTNAVELAAATLAALETIELGSTTLAALESVTVQNTVDITNKGNAYGASFKSTALLAANTPETIFTPAANVNGALIVAASFIEINGTGAGWVGGGFLAKTSAPANQTDGDAILSGSSLWSSGGSYGVLGELPTPIIIPAGKGLYFISAQAQASGTQRSVLYTLL